MKKKTITPKFLQHIREFVDSLQLMKADKQIAVAVSGGVDSIGLMYAMKAIAKSDVRVLHINHGTRPECAEEEELVLAEAKKLGLTVDVYRFSLNLNEANFEAVARNIRAQIYKQYLQKDFWVYTAHHLDDSFEWSMIQSFKQASLKGALGIPVFNKGLVRPFMCVSKKHIRKYVLECQARFASDGSNRDLRFERNFFREKLTKIIQNRYPQYLRHYVARQNLLAMELKKHRKQDLLVKKKISRIVEKREASGAVVLKSHDFSFHKEHIKEWIHFFSKNHRGEIDREVDKLIAAHQKIKADEKELKMKGPMMFSGGVSVFILDDYFLIANDAHIEYYKEMDELLLQYLEHTKNNAQITAGFTNRDIKKIFFPYLCFLPVKNRSKSSKLVHPLLKKSTSWLKTHKIPYSFYPLIRTKRRQTSDLHAVILDSSVLGL